MSDRTCIKCYTKFRYPSTLKTHLEKSSRCAISSEEINIFFSSFESNDQQNDQQNVQQNIQTILEPIVEPIVEPILELNVQQINNNNIKIKNFYCNICNKLFTRKSSLLRHQREISCFIKNETTILNPTENINSNQIPNQIQNQIYNTNNQNTINSNNTINNTIINNNTTIIQHINPFGFEDVRTISIPEMKKILSSGENSGLQIIKAIYNKIENKNFYKPNMSRPEIACLNTDFNLTIYKCKEFGDALFDRCITFLHHMLYLCKNEYSKTAIKNIYDNIEHIETTMRIEIYDKKLQNIIESEFRNNNLDTKDRIKNFIKKLKEESEIKDNSLLQIKNTLELKEEKKNEYKKSITNLEINNLFGDPKVILGLKKEEILLNLRITRFEESMFYQFWIDRLNNIKKYVMNNTNSKIGDIINLTKEEQKIISMLDIIRNRVDTHKGNDYINLNINDEFRIDDIVIQN